MPSKEDAASGIVFRNFRLIEELSPRHNVALSAAGGRPELALAGLLVLLGGVVAPRA